MSLSGPGREQRAAIGAALEVVISVQPPENCGCSRDLRATSNVRQSMTFNAKGEWTCHLILGDDENMEFYQNEVCDGCPCYHFAVQECVAEIIDIRPPCIHYSIIVPDRSKIAPLIESLREGGASVSVHRIRVAGNRRADDSTLTDKQRETIELALRMGYFEQPRRANLQDIADKLDVTPSAVSQRLNSVNRRLINLYAENNCIS